MNHISNSHRVLRLFLPALTLFNLILAACSTAATPTSELIGTPPESLGSSATPESTNAPTAVPLQTSTRPPFVTVTARPSPTVTPPPYNPDALSIPLTDLLFTRDAPESVTLFNRTIELWSVAPDGSGEGLVTTFNPADLAPFPHGSPDGRYIALSDTPGLVVLDKLTGEKIVVAAFPEGETGIHRIAWLPDGTGLYYTLEDISERKPHTIYFQSVPPAGDPVEILSTPSATIEYHDNSYDIPEYPNIVLSEGRLILRAIAYEFPSWDTSVYDPAADQTIPITSPFPYLNIVDVHSDDTLLFYVPPAAGEFCPCEYYTGRLDSSGQIVDTHLVPGTDWFLDLNFHTDGRLIGHTHVSREDIILYIVEQDSEGNWTREEIMRVPDDELDAQSVAGFLDEDTIILYRVDNESSRTLWRYPLGGEPALIVTIFPHDP